MSYEDCRHDRYWETCPDCKAADTIDTHSEELAELKEQVRLLTERHEKEIADLKEQMRSLAKRLVWVNLSSGAKR